MALCYDGAIEPGAIGAQNAFRLDLGPKSDAGRDTLRDVTFLVTRREVRVRATRIAVGPTNEVVPYVVEGAFPMRDLSAVSGAASPAFSSGFWDPNDQICLEFDGVIPSGPPLADVLATGNVVVGGTLSSFTSNVPAIRSNGVFNNNTTPCTNPGAANRCGQNFVVNVIMKH